MEGLSGAAPAMNWSATDLPAAWQAFREHAMFMFDGPLSDSQEAQKCNYLMLWIGAKGREVYKTFDMTNDQKKVLGEYYRRFEAHVKPKTNRVYARYKFQSRIQGPDETFETFVTDLKLQARDCGFRDPDEMVRDRIVFGVKSSRVREKLIDKGSDLSLDTAIDIGLSHEISQQQLKTMSVARTVEVNMVQSRRRENRATANDSPNPKCGYCGYDLQRNHVCPAKGKECNKCGKLNHFATVCRSMVTKDKSQSQRRDRGPRKSVHTVDEESGDDNEEDEFFIGALYDEINTITPQDEWFEDIKIGESVITFQLDTGAKCSTITWKDFQKLKSDVTLEDSDTTLWSYSGHQVHVKGKADLLCTYQDEVVGLKFYVVEAKTHSVLSGDACKKLKLVKRLHTIMQSPSGSELLSDCPELFDGLGCLPGKYAIKIDDSVEPVINPPRRVPVALRDRVIKELENMTQQGVIVPQKDPTPWVNSMVTVVKGDKIRICLDPTDLNKAIQREHYPMRTIEEVASRMPNAKCFSRFDAKRAYWQIALDKRSSLLTTFNTPNGRYRFTRLPFGISSASEVFQRAMEETFRGLDGIEIIHDDLLVWGTSRQEHDVSLRNMLERARQTGIKFTLEKVEVRVNSVQYVGHILSDRGLKPTADRVEAILEMPPPDNKEDLLRFLGVIQYLSKFMPNLSQEAAPLRILLKKDVQWHWEFEQQQSFEKLRKMAATAPTLRYFDPARPIILSNDASSHGLGAVLMQENRPVACCSRALTSTQMKYAQIEKELLAIVFACHKFHDYIYSLNVTVETDHKPLVAIFRKHLHELSPRLQRMRMKLQRYDLRVIYVPGKELVMADAFSRAHLSCSGDDLFDDQLDINSVGQLPMSPDKLSEFHKATSDDPTLQTLQDIVMSGWPAERYDVPADVRVYWTYRDEISTMDGLMFKGPKIIVPKMLRTQVLRKIHESHLGIVKCKQRARDILFWPGMSSDIQDIISRCSVCAEHAPENSKEPMHIADCPERPWSKVGSDLFQYKDKHYILCVDYY